MKAVQTLALTLVSCVLWANHFTSLCQTLLFQKMEKTCWAVAKPGGDMCKALATVPCTQEELSKGIYDHYHTMIIILLRITALLGPCQRK